MLNIKFLKFHFFIQQGCRIFASTKTNKMKQQDLTYWVTEINRLTSWDPDFIRQEILRRKSIQCFLAGPFWDARQWIMFVEKSQLNS